MTESSRTLSPTLKTNQETTPTPTPPPAPISVVCNLVFKTSWTAPAYDTSMENCDNLLLLESAI